MKRILFFILVNLGLCTPLLAQLKGIIRGVSLNDTVALNGAKVKLLHAKKIGVFRR